MDHWADELEDAAVVINLAQGIVNCRYGSRTRRATLDARVNSVRAIRLALEKTKHPPPVWLQAATATTYAHPFDAPNDELSGVVGGNEPDAPSTWRFSIDVANAWGGAVIVANPLTNTRTVIMRSAMIMGPDQGGIFATPLGLVRLWLGDRAGTCSKFV